MVKFDPGGIKKKAGQISKNGRVMEGK